MLFATWNPNKLAEASAIMEYTLEQIDLGELDEIQSVNVEEVIKHKAKAAYERVGKPVLVEDVGLSFRARNGLPGALIKWFLERQQDKGIMKMLEPFEDRHVIASCYVGYYDGEKHTIVKGEVEWTVPYELTATSMFGRDALFMPHGHDKTYAQMTKDEKNAISHRGIAWRKMKQILNAL